MRVLRRTAVLILLGLTLGTPWAGASPPWTAEATPHHVLDYLGSLLASFWLKTGCVIDPLGRCAWIIQNNDAGCGMDPLGHCAPGTQSLQIDGGCTIDPNGRCTPDH